MIESRLRTMLSRKLRLWTLLSLLSVILIACSDIDKAGISSLLDTRDQAISNRSISEYSALISGGYHYNQRGKVEVVAQMLSLFDKFERAEMRSYDREIRILDNGRAQCEQSYTLRVFADGEWRQIIQREQLTLTEEDNGWKIISGL